MVDVRVFGCFEVTTVEEPFDPFEKPCICREDVREFAMRRAGFPHDHLTVFLNDLSLDLAGMGIHQYVQRNIAGDNATPDLLYTRGAKRIGLTRKTERRRRAFVGF